MDDDHVVGMLPLSLPNESVLATRSTSSRNPVSHEVRDRAEKVREELERITSTNTTSNSFESQLPWYSTNAKMKVLKYVPKLPKWVSERPYLSTDYLFLSTNQMTSGSLGPKEKEALVSPREEKDRLPLGSFSLQIQENIIIEDILFLMDGIQGRYINILQRDNKYHFQMDTTLDVSLHNLVERILPVCSDYVTIVKYTQVHSRYEYGMISQALCAAIQHLLKEYLILVAQLEHQYRTNKLTLQKLYYYIQPTMKTMQVLSKVVHTTDQASQHGGKLLNALFAMAQSYIGDTASYELFYFLLSKASQPYFNMLEQWIYHGTIFDPYSEFFIEERTELKVEYIQYDYDDSYWEQRYTMNKDTVPQFLARLADTILVTGKYLNVIKECGIQIEDYKFNDNNNSSKPERVCEKFEFSMTERDYHDKVQRAFNFASKTVLNLLIHGKQLIPRLKSVKHYFLLDQGDFFVHFMDAAKEELSRQVKDITPTKLDSLLELSLRTSISESDPYKDDLICDLLPYTLQRQLLKIIHVADSGVITVNIDQNQLKQEKLEALHMRGVEAFTFDYKVEWPLSLVLSRKAITKYQLLFRHLFILKSVERELCNCWEHHMSTRQYGAAARNALGSAFTLRHKMLHFIQNLEHYMMVEVLEPNWILLDQRIKQAANIDEVLKYHNDFLDSCLRQCMLTDPNLVKLLTRLAAGCMLFANFIHSTMRSIKPDTRDSEDTNKSYDFSEEEFDHAAAATARKLKQIRIGVESEQAALAFNTKFRLHVAKFDEHFVQPLKRFTEALQTLTTTEASHHLGNLIARLDFNGYYSGQFGTTQLVVPTKDMQ